jgi:DNA polymerase-1
MDAVWADLDAGDGSKVHAAVGGRAARQLASASMRETIARNRRLMQMRADLPLPDLDSMRLPVDLTVMQQALAERAIHLGPSLWALTGGSPPLTGSVLAFVRPREGARTARARRVPGDGQLALF